MTPPRDHAATWNTLPTVYPNCTGPAKGLEDMGTSPATGGMGHWFKHHLTGFHGVQCGRCGYLIEVAQS